MLAVSTDCFSVLPDHQPTEQKMQEEGFEVAKSPLGCFCFTPRTWHLVNVKQNGIDWSCNPQHLGSMYMFTLLILYILTKSQPTLLHLPVGHLTTLHMEAQTLGQWVCPSHQG